MATSNCKQCGREIKRNGTRVPVFCSLECKGNWQRAQKEQQGITRDWLYSKYVDEGLSTYEIAKIVGRNPKRVWDWLHDYDIPLREREWDVVPDPSIPYQQEEWLRAQYVDAQRSSSEIAAQFDVAPATILYFLRRFDIPTRNPSEVRAAKYWTLSGEVNGMYGKGGEDNPNWRGGVTPDRQSLYSSREWAQAVKVVWRRDQATCQRCGAKPDGRGQFHIHHRVSFAVVKLRTDPSNLVLLCRPCHHWVHSLQNVAREFLG